MVKRDNMKDIEEPKPDTFWLRIYLICDFWASL